MNDSLSLFPDSLLKAADSALQLLPLHARNPASCGAIDIRIAANGTWFHEGRPIQRAGLVRLFASILRRESDGRYYLVTPYEKLSIQVDDCPFVAVLLHTTGSGSLTTLTFELNTGEQVTAGAQHRIWVQQLDGAPHPVLEVRCGLTALLSRNVYYQLVEVAEGHWEEGADTLSVWSQGVRFSLGSAI